MKNFFKLFKENKGKAITLLLMFLLVTFGTFYLLYAVSLLNGIEDKIRILLSICLIIILLIFALAFHKSLMKSKIKKTRKYIFFIPITVLYSAVLILGAFYIIKTYKVVDKMTSNSTTYSTSLIALSDNKATKISDISDGKIGMLSDSTSVDGYTIPNEIIKKENLDNKISEYESYLALIQGLYNGEVEYAFLPTNYTVMFQTMEGANLENIKSETKIIYTKEKKVKKKSTSSSKSMSLNKPFTVLIMGVDSENESIANSSFNGDSLILITFNPSTLSTTMLSIPRDTYVPIMCFSGNKKNKITHAAWGGEDCMMKTIENFTGISIDYYVKINFKGVVKLVDTLGGVDVDVPYSFCEQNSNREFGNGTIYVNEGYQTLNGEQALAFARNRHTWPQYCGKKYSNYVSNDFVRGQNQQTVIRALLNKLKDVRSLDTVYDLLDAISVSMETNMTTNEILSLYNIGKDILVKSSDSNVEDLISIQRLYLSGTDAYIYEASMGLNLYNFVLYDESLEAVSEAMKINLGLKDKKIVKTFSFSIDKPYEEVIIGKEVSSTKSSSYDKNSSKKKCGTNEELGADGVTCLCKSGYTKVNGTCKKEETKVTCGTNEELGADGVTCLCKSGYTKVNGTCKKEEEKETKVTCGTNEELGADGVTCLCKSGYTKVNGVCTVEDNSKDAEDIIENGS